MSEPLFPEVSVKLTEVDGNAMSIISACSKAARRAGVRNDKIEEFHGQAMDGDYENLLRVCIRWFDIS